VPDERTWWDRNWKWLVPVTCLVPALVCTGAITMILAMVMEFMKSTPPYEQSLAAVTEHAAVREALGTPIEAGWVVTGNVESGPRSGHADITYTVSGPSGSARVFVVGDFNGAGWTYSRMQLEIEGTGERLDLLAKE
jgi:hypothetical protein